MDCAVPINRNIVPVIKGDSSVSVAPPAKAKCEPNLQGRVLIEGSKRWQYATDSCSYSDIFHSVVKGVHSFEMLISAINPRMALPKLSNLTAEADRLLDGIRFVTHDFKNLLNLHYYHDLIANNYGEFAGHVSMMAANYGSMMNLAGYLNIVNLERIATCVGKFSIFGRHMPKFVSNFVVGTFALEFQTAAFFFMGLQAGYDIFALGNTDKRRIVWLLTCVAEVVHKLFMIAFISTLSSPMGLATAGVLGVIANGLGGWDAYHNLSDQQGIQGHGPK